MRCPSTPLSPTARAALPLASSRTGVTEVELTWVEGRLEQWIRFGRVAAERIMSRSTKVVAFRPGAIFAFVRWTSNDYGTVHSSIAIIAAATAQAPYATLPFVRPGGDTAEANPLLEAPLDPGQFDLGQAVLRPAGRRRSAASRPARSLRAAHQRCTGRAGRMVPLPGSEVE